MNWSRGSQAEAVRRLPAPRREPQEQLLDVDEVTEHLRWALGAAAEGAAGNVLLLRLPASPVVPAGFAEQLAALQQVCALAVVVHGAGPDGDADGLAAVVFGPDVCHSMVARRSADGRYAVRIDTRPERVSLLSRELLDAV